MRKVIVGWVLLWLASACSGGGSINPEGTAGSTEIRPALQTPFRLDIQVDNAVRAQGTGLIEKIAVDLLDPDTLQSIQAQTVAERNGMDRVTVNILGVRAGRLVLRVQGLDASGVAVGLPVQRTVELVVGEAVRVSIRLNNQNLTRLDLDPTTAQIAVGGSVQINATGVLGDNQGQNLTNTATWTSADPTVAQVSSTGLVTGVSPGQTSISAQSGGITATATVTVTDQTPQVLTVTPAQATAALGSQVDFQATADFGQGQTQTVTATWTSSDTAVATVDGTGRVTALAVGSATITASFQGLTATATVTVTPATLASLAVAPANTTVAAGLNQPFVAIGTFSDGTVQDLTNAVVWSSSNPAIATIDPATGLASAVAEGIATVTATQGAVSGSTPLNVTNGIVSIAVTPVNPTRVAAIDQQFTAVATFADGSTRDVTTDTNIAWVSSDTAVATVSVTGLASTLAPGTTTITATLAGVTGQTVLTVNSVVPREFLVVTGTNQIDCYEIASDGTFTFRDSQPLGTPGDTITISPDRRFALVNEGGAGGNSLKVFSIDQTSGALSLVDTETVGFAPSRGTFGANGNFFFQPSQTASNVSVFSYAAGQLTPVAGSPFALPGGARAPALAFAHPGGGTLYLGTLGGAPGHIIQMNIGAGGALTIPGGPATVLGTNTHAVATSGNVFDLAANSSGSVVYATGNATVVDTLNVVVGTGALTFNSSIATGGGMGGMGVRAAGDLLYACNAADGELSGFAIAAGTGALAPEVAPFPLLGLNGPALIAQSPSGRRLAVSEFFFGSTLVRLFDIAANGNASANVANPTLNVGYTPFGLGITQLP